MKENLIKLRNTLYAIETKGTNTILMADCLKFIENMISDCDDKEGEE